MKRSATPYLFLLPYLAIFALFWAWPILESLLLSFQNTRVSPPVWNPSINWGRILGDAAFWDALRNTVLILVIQVPLMLALATALAVALNSQLLRAKGFFRFAFFAPVVVGAVAYSAVFRLLFNQNGAVNAALGTQINWIFDPVGAMAVIIITLTWRWTGYNAIIILASLQSIPKDLYEAAEIDGASPWQQFWRITVPSLRPVLLFCLVLSIIGTLQLFTEPWLITNGGPGTATTTLGVYLYRQGFQNINFGYASTIAYAITLLALVFSIIQLRLFGRES
ncbi:MAG: sugar ABC transporter permease [Meiothermus sp.]|nr:MAG: sugar ABC transporter permease [Meiothermus sp.]